MKIGNFIILCGILCTLLSCIGVDGLLNGRAGDKGHKPLVKACIGVLSKGKCKKTDSEPASPVYHKSKYLDSDSKYAPVEEPMTLDGAIDAVSMKPGGWSHLKATPGQRPSTIGKVNSKKVHCKTTMAPSNAPTSITNDGNISHEKQSISEVLDDPPLMTPSVEVSSTESAAGLSSEDDLQHADDEELVAITTGTSGDGSTSEAEPFLSTSLPDGIQQSVNAMPSSVDSVPEGDHAFNTATIFSENDSTTSGHETFPSNDIAPPQSTFAPFVPLPTFSPEKDVPLAPTGQHLTPSAGPSTSPIASSPPPTPSAESLGILMLSTEPWIPPPPSFDSQPTSVPPPSESMSQQQPVTTPASSAANPIVSTSATGTFQDNTANQRETHTPGTPAKHISNISEGQGGIHDGDEQNGSSEKTTKVMKKENNGPTDVEQKTTGKLIASSLNNSTVVYHSYNVGKLENYSPSFINVFHPPDQPNPRITRPLPRPSSATAINNFQHLPSVTKSTSNYRLDPSSGRPNVNLNVNSINANSRYNYFTDPRHRQSSPTKYHYPYYQPRRNPYSRNGYMQRPVYRPRPRGRGGYSPKDFLRSHLETNSYQRGRVDLKRLFWFPTAACKGPQRIKVENRPSTSTSAPLWPFMNYVSEIERGRNRNRNSNEEGDGWYVVRFVDDDSPIPIKKMSDHGLRNLPAEVSSIFSYLKNMYNTGPFSLNVNDIWRWFLHGDHVKSNK